MNWRTSISETRGKENRKRVNLRKTGEKALKKLMIARSKTNPFSGPDPMSKEPSLVKEGEQGTMDQLFLDELKKRLKQVKSSPYSGGTSFGTKIKNKPGSKQRELPGWAKRDN